MLPLFLCLLQAGSIVEEVSNAHIVSCCADPGAPTFENQLVSLGGGGERSISIRTAGNGDSSSPAFVFLSGFLPKEDLMPTAKYLLHAHAGAIRIALVPLLIASDRIDDDHSYWTIVNHTRIAVESLYGTAVHIVGHGFGGMVRLLVLTHRIFTIAFFADCTLMHARLQVSFP